MSNVGLLFTYYFVKERLVIMSDDEYIVETVPKLSSKRRSELASLVANLLSEMQATADVQQAAS